MQNYEIKPTWPNFFSHLGKTALFPPPKTVGIPFLNPKRQLADNHLSTPYQLLINSYHGRSW